MDEIRVSDQFEHVLALTSSSSASASHILLAVGSAIGRLSGHGGLRSLNLRVHAVIATPFFAR